MLVSQIKWHICLRKIFSSLKTGECRRYFLIKSRYTRQRTRNTRFCIHIVLLYLHILTSYNILSNHIRIPYQTLNQIPSFSSSLTRTTTTTIHFFLFFLWDLSSFTKFLGAAAAPQNIEFSTNSKKILSVSIHCWNFE